MFGNKTYSYDLNDRLVSDTHDANGNTRIGEVPEGAVIPGTGTGLEDQYDSENRLITRANSTKSIEIVYDGDGRRVKKTVTEGGVPATTYFINDDQNPTGYAQVLQEWKSGETQASVSYIYGHDLISQTVPAVSPATPVTHYYGYDGHGNVRFLINAAGVVKDTYTYDAFGTIIHQTDADGLVVGTSGTFNITPNRYLYCGEQWDSDLGFYYLRARYMNPDSGRFWTMDSYEGGSSAPLTLHKYLYVHANPVNGIDPSGHDKIEAQLVKAATITIVVRMAVPVYAKLGGHILKRGFMKWGWATGGIGAGVATLGQDTQFGMEIQVDLRSNPTGSRWAYMNEKCIQFAKDAMKYFKRQGKQPQEITYLSRPWRTVGGNIGAVEGFGLFGGQVIAAGGGLHRGVLVEGRVYDNNVPFGVPRSAWENGYWVISMPQRQEMRIGYAALPEVGVGDIEVK